MKTKRFLVYYNEDRELIGMREHHFDWEEGDVITTDGVRTVIFGIFEGTKKNLSLVKSMFNHLRRHLPKKKQVLVLDEGFHYTGDLFEDMRLRIEHGHYEWVDVRRRVWKSFDAQLDFVDAVFAQMENMKD